MTIGRRRLAMRCRSSMLTASSMRMFEAFRSVLATGKIADGAAARQVQAAATCRPALRHDFLHDLHDRAAARHAIAPDPIEIGEQRLDLLRRGCRRGRFDRGELAKSEMHGGDAAGPGTPTPTRAA